MAGLLATGPTAAKMELALIGTDLGYIPPSSSSDSCNEPKRMT